MRLRYTFRRAEKLHLQKDFQRVLKSGRRLAHPALFIYTFARRDDAPERRLGLITSRKVGTAVRRNRVKRLLREVFRLNKHRIAPGTDVIFVLRAGAVGLEFAQIRAVVLAQLDRAGVLLKGESA